MDGSELLCEKMAVSENKLYIVSSFENVDYFDSYTHTGDLVWEAAFTSKIISWKIQGNRLFIFSENRNGHVFYLTCFDVNTGKLLWEKNVLAPSSEAS
jgi:outer membrane protein assembly factor BamB